MSPDPGLRIQVSATPNPNVSVNDNTTGTGQNQFNYTGTWSYGSQTGAYLSDNHWTSTTNNAYQIAFTGKQVQIYAAKANSHGIFAVSIDGGAWWEVGVPELSPSEKVKKARAAWEQGKARQKP